MLRGHFPKERILDIFHLLLMLSVAENESDRTSERIKFVFNAKLARKEAFFKLKMGYTKEKIIDNSFHFGHMYEVQLT